MYTSINPHTGVLEAQFHVEKTSETDAKLQHLHEGFLLEKRTLLETRIQKIKALEVILAENAEHCAELMAQEMGKPLKQGLDEIQKCREGCLYFAAHADRYLAPHYYDDGAVSVLVPKGIILAIMPWNFPFWQVFRFILPSLLLGNAVLLKPAPNVPKCALKIAELTVAAGFGHLFQTSFLSLARVEHVIADPRIQGVTLTGSVAAGRAVAEQAGRYGKPVVLELGGADPWIICEDADLKKATETTSTSKLTNAGQVCIAPKRVYVHHSHFEDFIFGVKSYFQSIKIGDPKLITTEMGPLARKDLLQRVQRQVKESIAMGATSHLIEAALPDQDGWYCPPYLLTDVTPEMPVLNEECFGPVAVVIPFADDHEALALANASNFGLGAAVWTASSERASWFASLLEVGTVAVNARVKTQFHLPFGGTKASGVGRELGDEGFRAFANLKVVT